MPLYRKIKRTPLLRQVGVSLCTAMAALIISSCDGEGGKDGVEWVYPADEALPAAFSAGESVPVYAEQWHMPKGFLHFTARWNERVRQHVEQSLKIKQAEQRDALAAMLAAPEGSPEYKTAQVRRIGKLPPAGPQAQSRAVPGLSAGNHAAPEPELATRTG